LKQGNELELSIFEQTSIKLISQTSALIIVKLTLILKYKTFSGKIFDLTGFFHLKISGGKSICSKGFVFTV